MPITPERASLYPDDWPDISIATKDAAGWKCVACGAQHGPASGRAYGVHHFDDDPANCEPWNLHALCQTCHVTITASNGWDPFKPQTLALFDDATLARCDPLFLWFRHALQTYRENAPGGGRARPRPLTPRKPPSCSNASNSRQLLLYDDPGATLFANVEPMPRTRVVHCMRDTYDVFIGRPSKWGNPFKVRKGKRTDGLPREVAIERYREWIKTRPELLASLHELRGKRIACWCAPLACHGDVLAELADAIAHGQEVRA
ncbi:MAG: DUF4326 domain-containing protein [Planctomycetota bacterium]